MPGEVTLLNRNEFIAELEIARRSRDVDGVGLELFRDKEVGETSHRYVCLDERREDDGKNLQAIKSICELPSRAFDQPEQERTARGKLSNWNRVMAGKTISLVKGLPDSLAKSANEEKATAKGVNDQRKLEEAERYPAYESGV